MKIKEIKCDQFAGLKDRAYSFEDGLNLMIGDNESGKSSLVDVLYHVFFQGINLKGSKSEVKDFKERYYPLGTGAFQGDVVDGTVRFETDQGVYRLRKEWAEGGDSARLTMPDGTILQDGDTIQKVLDDALGYGRGIYDELIFASQRRNRSVLNALLSQGKSTTGLEELGAGLTKAVMETGGIDLDEIEKELAKRIKDYEDHWDLKQDMPEKNRGIKNPWKYEIGRILEAYYAQETVRAALTQGRKAEEAVDGLSQKIIEKKKERQEVLEKKDRFSQVRSQIQSLQANKQLLAQEDNNLREMQTAQSQWPEKKDRLEQAITLSHELEQARLKEKYEAVKKLVSQKEENESCLKQLGTVDAEAYKEAEGLDKELPKLEAKLQGLNVEARIKKLGEAEVQIRALSSGEPLDMDGEKVGITEAVDITVPGAVQILLSPKGVDVEALKQGLKKKRDRLAAILGGYGDASFEQLKSRRDEIQTRTNDQKGLEKQIQTALGADTWEVLQSRVGQMTEQVRAVSVIEPELKQLCGASADKFMGEQNAILKTYRDKYGSMEKLAESIRKSEQHVDNLKLKVEDAGALPEEFAAVEDPDAYEQKLKKEVQTLDQTIEDLGEELREADRLLGEKSVEEYEAELVEAEAQLAAVKKEYGHWKHIQEEFLAQKAAMGGNPLEDIEKYFTEYLSLLSEGRLSLNAMGDKFDSSITSGSSRLKADILSDGTKDAIEMAFRLAVLKHLYPQGGCTVVFDDPFTEMDPKRTAKACKLLEEFARDNQVIFVSCDDKYTKMMPQGHLIEVKD